MEQLNFGVKVELWDSHIQTWVSLENAFLTEAGIYKWRAATSEPESFQWMIQDVPITMRRTRDGWAGLLELPFQSGEVMFTLYVPERSMVRKFVYPDNRKMTKDQFKIMLDELLKEANVLFQSSGFSTRVLATGHSRESSWLQWQYIQEHIVQLRDVFRQIKRQPIQRLVRQNVLIKREKVKRVNPTVIAWIDRQAQGISTQHVPAFIRSDRSVETTNVYENRVLLRQLKDLEQLLKVYCDSGHDVINRQAGQYIDWVRSWKKTDFLRDVRFHGGLISISQSFRKHPYYRQWFRWFQDLYNFRDLSFDIGYPLSLKDTFQLYEMWVFMKVVEALRDLDLVETTDSLFLYEEERFFLTLAENHESRIQLKNGGVLTYQKVIQSNSRPFKSYTQRMIPDVTIEMGGKLLILDPKYRVNANIGHALAEMHKYRDGIVHFETHDSIVEEVYIITPAPFSASDGERKYFHSSYHEKYKMGAIRLTPGDDLQEFKEWLGRKVNCF